MKSFTISDILGLPGTPSDSDSSSSPGSDLASSLEKLDRQARRACTSSTSEKKPPHSYVALVGMAILSSGDNKMLLNDIYTYIIDRFPYYDNQQKAWRSNVRHSLSINCCFYKNRRAESGKFYWSLHPDCIADFSRGDFSKPHNRRRVRRNLMMDHCPRVASPSSYALPTHPYGCFSRLQSPPFDLQSPVRAKRYARHQVAPLPGQATPAETYFLSANSYLEHFATAGSHFFPPMQTIAIRWAMQWRSHQYHCTFHQTFIYCVNMYILVYLWIINYCSITSMTLWSFLNTCWRPLQHMRLHVFHTFIWHNSERHITPYMWHDFCFYSAPSGGASPNYLVHLTRPQLLAFSWPNSLFWLHENVDNNY